MRTKPILNDVKFRDSSLMSVELSRGLNHVTLVVFVPNATSRNGVGAYFQLNFHEVLRLEYEAVGLGDPLEPIEISDIYLCDDAETARWKKRIRTLTKSAGKSNEVFHVVIESFVYMGYGRKKNLHGVHLICRHFDIQDVTTHWPDAKPATPHRIPSKLNRKTKSKSALA